MASRRPRSARIAGSSSAPTRPKATPAIASVSESTFQPESGPSDLSRPASPPANKPIRIGDQKQTESNVQVVVRLRGSSQKEIDEGSPPIVTTKGARGDEVTIETALPTTTLGVYHPPPTRTYPFDKVFGAEADQAMIYNDVVAPILDEVVSGYNCTLFAYGQTGTGKTHTMQGDLTPTITGAPGPDAGMIPRVLAKLFQYLDTHVADYSVKVSFIELYNEELRDLLASDLSAPSNSTQPMDRAGAKNNVAVGGLKIFDEAGSGKRGVTIQGLEEVPVKDAKSAVALLRKGSHRRQIAATKFNEHSSRSHSIFTISVHTKETSAKGDDMLRVGKLNLVDLAGSENIGRSGAENKRAREAGMINQSLLTLGRVINALVEKSSHVPYRESKLTRLLQDSLGGRTKTCIIATISPARSNMEETLSTLDYAISAKSIRNKPELNQKMTRNGLLKEYVVEIERLKGDLVAAREKNGIFFSKESWDELSQEQEAMRKKGLESKGQIERLEMALTRKREEFEDFMTLFTKRERELEHTKETLDATTVELEKTGAELGETKVALDEETILRAAHAHSEQSLHEVASGLRTVVKTSLSDVGGLFDKLGRKTSMFKRNSGAVANHGSQIGSQTQELEDKLAKFTNQHVEVTKRLQEQAQRLEGPEVEMLSAQTIFIKERMARFSTLVERIQYTEGESGLAVETLNRAIEEAAGGIVESFKTWQEELTANCQAYVEDVTAACGDEIAKAASALKSASDFVDAVVLKANEYVVMEQENLLQIQTLTATATATEIRRLQYQNALLTELVDAEKVKAQKTRDSLIADVSSLLVKFTDERDKSLRLALGTVREEMTLGQKEINAFEKSIGATTSASASAASEISKGLDIKKNRNKRLRDDGLKAMDSLTQAIEAGVDGMASGVEQNAIVAFETIQSYVKDINTASFDATERIGRNKRARLESTTSVDTDVRDAYDHLQKVIVASSNNVASSSRQLLADVHLLQAHTSTNHLQTSAILRTLGQHTRELLVEGTKEDLPTGSTPKKRQWQYVDQWQLTGSRNEVLQDWRSGPSAPSGQPQTTSHAQSPCIEEVMEGGSDEPELCDVTEPQHPEQTLSVPRPEVVGQENEPVQRSPSPSSSMLSSSASSSQTESTAGTSTSALAPPPVVPPPPPPVRVIQGRVRTQSITVGAGTRRVTKGDASSKIPGPQPNSSLPAPLVERQANIAPLRRRLR